MQLYITPSDNVSLLMKIQNELSLLYQTRSRLLVILRSVTYMNEYTRLSSGGLAHPIKVLYFHYRYFLFMLLNVD